MSKILSVVICTHNPKVDYLNQVLTAIVKQSLSTELWELIIIDNASQPGITELDGLILPDFARIISEPKLGLTQARIRAIRETLTERILFVDDDNILDEDYLEQLIELHKCNPEVAVWSGNITPVFETEPAESTKPYWSYLAIREVKKETWSNMHENAPLPCGAGMSVRRDVAVHYCEDTLANPLRFMLGRKGKSLLAGEDTDIGLAACDLGLGVGLTPKLRLRHLIPSRRLQMPYLNNLVESITYSHELLNLVRGLTYISRRRILKQIASDILSPCLRDEHKAFKHHKRQGYLRAHYDYWKYRVSGNLPSAETGVLPKHLISIATELISAR